MILRLWGEKPACPDHNQCDGKERRFYAEVRSRSNNQGQKACYQCKTVHSDPKNVASNTEREHD